MKPTLLELDPNGDAVFRLLQPNAQIPYMKRPTIEEVAKLSKKQRKKRLKKQNEEMRRVQNRNTGNETGAITTFEHAGAISAESTTISIEPTATITETVSAGGAELAGVFSEPLIASFSQSTTNSAILPYETTDINSLKEIAPKDESGNSYEIQLRVSSSHLCLASPVFLRMLRGPFEEGILRENRQCEIRASHWNVEALLIVLDIIHGHHRNVPKEINLDLFEMISTIVDYYGCHESVELYVDIWLPSLRGNLPNSFNEEAQVWLSISWVFRQSDIFNNMAALARMQSQGPMDMADLPIPKAVIDAMESDRTVTLERIFQMLHDLQQTLRAEEGLCDCSSMMLGALIKQMDKAGITVQNTNAPYIGYSVGDLLEKAKTFTSRPLCSRCSYFSSPCRLETRMIPALARITESANGRSVKEIWDLHEKSR